MEKTVLNYRKANKEDFEQIICIWEKSVLETHNFLSNKDRISIKKELPSYFPKLDIYLWYKTDNLIGFSACNDKHLEMLFIDPFYSNQGLGTSILQQLILIKRIETVDVNEQNEIAKRFYCKNGFYISNRSEYDYQNRHYPLLHLKKR